jgi:hypothetical protein
MNAAPPGTLDFDEVLRSLLRGWRWIGSAFVLAAVATGGILASMPVRHQSTLKLRLVVAREPLMASYGLHLGAGEVVSLMMSPETRQAAASLDTNPAVADTGGWAADQVTAVGNGHDTVFVVVRDEDPDLAASTANAVERAARQVRVTSLQQGLREVLLLLEQEHEDLFTRLEELEGTTDSSTSTQGPLGEGLHALRLESLMSGVVALERQMIWIRSRITDPPRDWRIVEEASPGHALRDQSSAKALVAVLAPTLLAAIAWLIHDGRSRRT